MGKAKEKYARADKKGIALPNLIHASDSPKGAQKEIHLWFSDSEIFDQYDTVHSTYM